MNMNNNTNSSTIHPLNHYINQNLPPITNSPPSTTPVRTRITRACDHCQLRKTKCDSAKPRCSQCVKRNDPCTFTTRVCKRGPKPKRYGNPYQSSNQQLQKSTNVYPYPNYFSENNQSPLSLSLDNNELKVNSARRSSYPPPTANNQNVDYNLSSSSDYSPRDNYEYQKLPPIQSTITAPVPQRSNSTSLRLPSLANSLNLPPINILLSDEDSKFEGRNIGKAISSPSIYKLNTDKKQNQTYYSPPLISNTNLKVLLKS